MNTNNPNAPFSFSVEKGVRLEDETFKVLARAKRVGTHGSLLHVHASRTGFAVTYRDGHVRKLGDVRLYNEALENIQSETSRRKAWKAAHPEARVHGRVVHPSGLDERMAAQSAVPPLDMDRAHQRPLIHF